MKTGFQFKNWARAVPFLVPLLCFCLATGLFTTELAAEETEAQRQVFRDWEVLRADEAGECLAYQAVVSRRSGLVLLQALLFPDETGAVLNFRVPTGVSLRDGIAYRHPSTPQTAVALAWQSCNADTCLAQGKLSSAELNRLKKGRSVTVGYRPLPDSRLLNVSLSLLGISAAIETAQTCSAP